MCGFVGYSTPVGDQDANMRLARRMLDAVAHRGPDGTRVQCHGGVTLGHCALPFVDPVNGRQPFVSASGRSAIVFNGEIYNHEELRRELTNQGAQLSTASDTEVLVELYERIGTRLVERIRGMFAFVVHDVRTQRFVLARDPFGKKPLYYVETPAGLVFASELSALLRHPSCPRQINLAAVADYLVLQAFAAPTTAVAGVSKVRPGSYVEIARPELPRETTYWTLRLPPVSERIPAAGVEREFERLLFAAVGRRLKGTNGLGVLLSGGVDSSTIAAVLGQLSDGQVKTFSAGFEDVEFDESASSELASRHLGTEHYPIRIGSRHLADVMVNEYGRLDEPLADPSLLPTILLCRHARRQVRSVLTGDGADELLLGYRFFQAERAMEPLLRVIPPKIIDCLPRLMHLLPVRHGNLPLNSVLQQLAQAMSSPPERRFYESKAPFSPYQLPGLFRRERWEELGNHYPYAQLDEVASACGVQSPLERAQLGIVCHFLRDVILTKVDRGSMLNSLEARSPFLDVELVEFCAALPIEQKLHGWAGKYLLRRVAAQWLPAEVAWGKKVGFRAPIASLLCEQLRPVLIDLLSPQGLAMHGLFSPTAVRRLIDDHLALRKDNASKLWALLCFQIWYDGVLCAGGSRSLTLEVTQP